MAFITAIVLITAISFILICQELDLGRKRK